MVTDFDVTTITVENQYIYIYILHILSMCLFVALGIQHAMRMRHIVICSLLRYTKFLHIVLQTARFFWGRG